eukprot:GHUV01011759.1.p2 GENE.GHUV01011759.1~~GHUV01011759.1.p2  ORF type:complete len:129 (+),score=42.17 GHUV01011759.1:1063-1449(+)
MMIPSTACTTGTAGAAAALTVPAVAEYSAAAAAPQISNCEVLISNSSLYESSSSCVNTHFGNTLGYATPAAVLAVTLQLPRELGMLEGTCTSAHGIMSSISPHTSDRYHHHSRQSTTLRALSILSSAC